MAIKLIIDGEAFAFDEGRLMLSEGVALEEQWGIDPAAFDKAMTAGAPSFRLIGALAWLVKVRALAAEHSISIRDAAQQLPAASFDVNIGALRIEQVEEPVNPTPPATRTPATRTTRSTSAAKRAKRS